MIIPSMTRANDRYLFAIKMPDPCQLNYEKNPHLNAKPGGLFGIETGQNSQR